jgi:hypothetical protein
VGKRYERICFDKAQAEGPPPAMFVSPGNPLLDSTIDLVLEKHRGLLKQGAGTGPQAAQVMPDRRDLGPPPLAPDQR